MKRLHVSPFVLIVLGFGTMALSFAYYLYANGFPLPMQDASKVTSEQMARVYPPILAADAMFYAGLLAFCAGLFTGALRIVRRRR